MITTQLRKTVSLVFVKIDLATFLKKGVWIFLVIVSILYSLVGSLDDLRTSQSTFEIWVYVYFNFLSFILGVLAGAVIFYRRPSNWMAFMTSLMLITFTATDTGYRFWYLVFTGVPPSVGVQNGTVPYAISLFINVFYMALMTTSLAYVLLAFPEGRILSPRSRWFFGLMVGSQILLIAFIGVIALWDIFGHLGGDLSYRVYDFLNKVKAFVLIVLAGWPILRLRRITDPVQRQQIKWIASSLTGMTFFYAIYTFVPGEAPLVDVWLFLLLLVFTYGFIVTLFIAIMRYRLWDMDFVINKALVYSSMTAVLGMIGFVGAAVLNFLAEQLMEAHSPLVGVAVLVIIVALFNPVREAIQVIVDRHLKPEEVDFRNAIVEIAPDARLELASSDILKILVRQCVAQLNVSDAAIYLQTHDGQLVQVEPAALDAVTPQLRLDEKTRLQLGRGNMVIPPEGSAFSLYIPLVIHRPSRPDFLGVIVLGSRNSGEGYSTVLLKGLKQLGADAGRAIYLAQLRERLGQNVLERLAAIERGLSSLHPIPASQPLQDASRSLQDTSRSPKDTRRNWNDEPG